MGVGFGPSSELLLVTSHQGRGVFDCVTGQRVSRDAELDYSIEDPQRLVATGIGPLAGQEIRMAGLYGGGLTKQTSDFWHIETVYFRWPDQGCIVLMPEESDLWAMEGQRLKFEGSTRIHEIDSFRVAGFSASGKSLVIAESHTLTIFNRAKS
jgi:hypothetical protein